jgi:hypothetical protein
LPANTLAVSGDPVSSTKFNSLVQDLEADANVDRPIAAGGTGASTASAALTNLFSGATPGGADKIGGWDQSAAAFAFFSLGSGLSFSGTTIGLDADLVTLAGLTPTADNFIVGNAGGTAWEGKTPANARISLGLVIGTNVQAFDQQLADIAAMAVTDSGFIVGNGTTFVLETGATAQTSLGYTAADVLTKLLTVDGAGSSLDADTLDGVQGSAYATLTGSEALTNKTLTSPTINGGALSGTFTGAPTFSGGVTLTTPTINGGTSNTRVIASTETTGTLTVASANETIQATGDITVPNAVFAAGDIILIYAGASSRTITQGASVTMRLGGTATTGSRTLAARGVAVLFFVSASEVVVSGGAVT